MTDRPKDLKENYIRCKIAATTMKAYKCFPINCNFYKWIAKSLCYVDENGNVYAPKRAIFNFNRT